MAAPTVQTIVSGGNVLIINVRKVFDTDDADAVIVDKSTLTGPLGIEPSKIAVMEIWWTIQGYGNVLLEFDRDTDNIIGSFSGQGYIDYMPYGGKIDQGANGTGDILLTSTAGSANGSYNFVIKMRLKK